MADGDHAVDSRQPPFSPERIAALHIVRNSLFERHPQRPGQPPGNEWSSRRRRPVRALRRGTPAPLYSPGTRRLRCLSHRGGLFSLPLLLGGLLVEFTSPELGGEDARFSQALLKRRRAASGSSASRTRTLGIQTSNVWRRPPRCGDGGARSGVRPHKRQRSRRKVRVGRRWGRGRTVS